MIFKKGFLFYGFFNIRLFIFLLFHRFDLLVANDLDTLLPNFLISKLKRLPLLYDSHEYFTEVPELQNSNFVKSVWGGIERMIFPGLRNVMTVSEPIASAYEKKYHVKALVVRNVSRSADHITAYSKPELGFPKDDMLFILQGNGINIDKGGEELINAVNLSAGVSLLIVGSGDVIPVLKRMVGELNMVQKVKFIPTVSWENLMRYTKSADAGMCIEKDTNLNYRFSLPNKLFDYLAAGIPVIASDLPETSKIIKEYSLGILISAVTPENICKAISELKNNPERIAQLRENALAASKKLNWETESEKVTDFYNKVLSQ